MISWWPVAKSLTPAPRSYILRAVAGYTFKTSLSQRLRSRGQSAAVLLEQLNWLVPYLTLALFLSQITRQVHRLQRVSNERLQSVA